MGKQKERGDEGWWGLRAQHCKKRGVGVGAPLRCPELRRALKEMISTCLLSSAAPRLQIKNQLRAGRRICQAEAAKAGALGCKTDGGDWQGRGGRSVGPGGQGGGSLRRQSRVVVEIVPASEVGGRI